VITYLKVRNLAIVEELAIEPGPGLNVLTGETGAGKSLLIDSLEFLRGARGSTEMIRAGSDRMTAEAVFQLPAKLRPQLDELGIELDCHPEPAKRGEGPPDSSAVAANRRDPSPSPRLRMTLRSLCAARSPPAGAGAC
jgi:DNA repair protein RecN (Recombination protein N)